MLNLLKMGNRVKISEILRLAELVKTSENKIIVFAQGLVVKERAGHCLHYVEALPHQEGVKNPAGWLPCSCLLCIVASRPCKYYL
jgi:hypothetical protein